MRTILTICAVLGLLAGCGARPQEKRYPIRGEVKALDTAAKVATIQHGKIGDWMEAMTMEFPVAPDSDFQKLQVGDQIEGTVVVTDARYHVTDVKVTGKAPPAPPASSKP